MINNEFQLQFFFRALLILTSLSLIQISSCRMRENCKSRIYLQYQARPGTVCMPIVNLGLPSGERRPALHKFYLRLVSRPGWFSPAPLSPCLPRPSSPRHPRLRLLSSALPILSVWQPPGRGSQGASAYQASHLGSTHSSPTLE